MATSALRDLLMDVTDDADLYALGLRRDQQLEYAKEYNSIIAEPLGSRLKARYYNHLCCFSPAPARWPVAKQSC